MEWLDFAAQIASSAIRLSVPLLFACLAGLYSERSGVFDIGLEGKMLVAAFAAGACAAITGSAWLGLAGAIIASVGFSLINFMAVGLTAQLGATWFGTGGQTPQLTNDARFLSMVWPFADALRGVPIIGHAYSQILSGHNILVYLAFLAVPLTWWVLYRTRFGLRLRAVGENPAAVDTAGISVSAMRYSAVICAGILCGFAGAYLSIAQSASFVENMTAGKGFIALAALIFAKWRPVAAMWACLLFGVLEAVAIRLQGVPIAGVGPVPVQLMQAVPYILTVVLLAGFIGRAVPPRAGGVAYVKEK
jgi:simple sugar transport system permease protein